MVVEVVERKDIYSPSRNAPTAKCLNDIQFKIDRNKIS